MRSHETVAVLDRPEVLTPEAAFNLFLDHRDTHKDITRTTQETYISRFRLFGAFLREEGITDVRRQLTTNLLEKYFALMGNRTDLRATEGTGKQLSRRTVHSHFISIRALVRFLYFKKYLSENLCRTDEEGGVRVKKPSRKQKIAPKREVVERIITVFNPEKPPAVFEKFSPAHRRFMTALVRALVIIMAGLGLRSAEALGLRKDQIEWREQTVTFKAKGDSERQDRMDFTDDVKAVLLAYLDEREKIEVKPMAEDLFFVTFAGRVLDRDALRWIFGWIKTATGYRLTPHQLRYFAGTEFYRKTKDIVLTQRFLRHANVETTRGYLGLDPDEVREKTLASSPVAGLLRR